MPGERDRTQSDDGDFAAYHHPEILPLRQEPLRLLPRQIDRPSFVPLWRTPRPRIHSPSPLDTARNPHRAVPPSQQGASRHRAIPRFRFDADKDRTGSRGRIGGFFL